MDSRGIGLGVVLIAVERLGEFFPQYVNTLAHRAFGEAKCIGQLVHRVAADEIVSQPLLFECQRCPYTFVYLSGAVHRDRYIGQASVEVGEGCSTTTLRVGNHLFCQRHDPSLPHVFGGSARERVDTAQQGYIDILYHLTAQHIVVVKILEAYTPDGVLVFLQHRQV